MSALAPQEVPVGVETCGANGILPKGEVSSSRLTMLWHELQRAPATQGGAGLLVGRSSN